MAEENKEMEVDGEEMMEEGDEDWEYYDDNDVLTDFWQVCIEFTQLNYCLLVDSFIFRTSSRMKLTFQSLLVIGRGLSQSLWVWVHLYGGVNLSI